MRYGAASCLAHLAHLRHEILHCLDWVGEFRDEHGGRRRRVAAHLPHPGLVLLDHFYGWGIGGEDVDAAVDEDVLIGGSFDEDWGDGGLSFSFPAVGEGDAA